MFIYFSGIRHIHITTFCLLEFDFLKYLMNRIIHHIFWLAYFTWLNVLMLKPVSEFPSILRLNGILLYAYIIFCLSVDGHLACFHILAIVNNVAWICGYRYLFQSLLLNGLPLSSFDSVFWCRKVLNFDGQFCLYFVLLPVPSVLSLRSYCQSNIMKLFHFFPPRVLQFGSYI